MKSVRPSKSVSKISPSWAPRRFARPPIHSSSTSPSPSWRPYKRPRTILFGVLAATFSAYASFVYTSISKEPSKDPSLPAQDADVSNRYNNTAGSFDELVGSYESFSFINYRRKQLARQAKGHVLEVSVGTGRNLAYYKLKRCKSLTFVDVSRQMLAIAETKFSGAHPEHGSDSFPPMRVAFVAQSALDPLPINIAKQARNNGGYDTVLQTMGLCSTPQPTKLLMHLGTLAHPERGRILLLEHGRSHYDWLNKILDKLAAERADKQGCWWNRDIGKIVEESGLVVDKIRRKHFGTLWMVEARPRRDTDSIQNLGQSAEEDIRTRLLRWVKGADEQDQQLEDKKEESRMPEKD